MFRVPWQNLAWKSQDKKKADNMELRKTQNGTVKRT